MGRLILVASGLLVLAGCKPEPTHDLTPLEQAVAGFWEKNYTGFGTIDGTDLEHLELRPNRTGHWYVSRGGQSILSNTMYIHNWEVRNDSLHLDAHVKPIAVPRPDGTVYHTDSIPFYVDFVPLHLTADSVILKEVCNLQKSICDGVQTWYNRNTLEELVRQDPDSVTLFTPPKRLKEIGSAPEGE
ncbi:MAG: hypothetical protein ACON34_11350 [Flavobacteriales bacterium]